ncbi:MAG TPA: acyl-CoA thioester hydrolase/BAAT C-terminal domain-containing protein [Reyranella sp.]
MTAARASVDHRVALADRDVQIEFAGFSPGEPVTVTATQVFRLSRWQAKATFRADAGGRISIARQAPVSGTYADVSAMGLFWSAERLPDPIVRPPDDWILTPWQVHVEATGGDGARAELVLDRLLLGPGVTRHIVRSDGLVGWLFLPPGEPKGAVIVLGGGGGTIDEYWGAMLASHGYAALNLAYFNQPGLPRGLVNIPLEYFDNAIRWMRKQPWLGNRLLAVWGPSRGGELALLLGATFPDINAVAAWVPSGVMFWGIGPNDAGDDRASWTFRGKPLPYLQQDNPFAATVPALERDRPIAYAPIYRSHLQDRHAVERATIAVEQIRGPVQLVSGADDQMWPSAELADIAFHRLQEHRHPYPFRHLKFDRAGHQILIPHGPRTVLVSSMGVVGFEGYLYSQGGTAKDNADAGAAAWRDLLAFLAEACASRRLTSP